MASPSTFSFLTFSLLITLSYSAAAKKPHAYSDLVHASCLHASYPRLCLRTLSSYSRSKTPGDVAKAAVFVGLSRARRVASFLSGVKASSKRSRQALSDCVEQISDSVDQLQHTLSELRHLRGETFRWQMSNAETWVSAALTNEDTCLDGFQDVEEKFKGDVNRKIKNVAKVTSNALYLINRLDRTRGRATSSHP